MFNLGVCLHVNWDLLDTVQFIFEFLCSLLFGIFETFTFKAIIDIVR